MKMFALLLVSALALGACAPKEPVPTRQLVSEISVNTDLSAIGNRQAVAYWSKLGDDLKTALASEFVNDIAPGGAKLTVDVDGLSLANAYSSKFGENSTLRGLAILKDGTGKVINSYTVTATTGQAMQYMPAGSTKVVSPDSADFYAALVSAFARGVYDAVQNPPPAS